MAMTLEQLKDENAKAEATATPDPQKGEATDETPAAKEELEADTGAETSDGEEGESKVEPWMQSGEEESDTDGHASDERQFTGSDIAAAKRKLRAKLDKRNEVLQSEKEALEARVKALESGRAATPATGAAEKPQRDSFETDEAFFEALADWKIATNSASQHAETEREKQQRKIREYEEQTSEAVDQHYTRAVTLAEKSNITPEMYQAADLRVREMAEEVFPKAGDEIVESLIATLGEGSEKVMYNLGVNTARRNKLRDLLKQDQTGLRAATYLGQLKGELNPPGKKRTQAPAPAADPTGDSKTTESFKALKAKYTAAHNKGDSQAAFNARREAKQAGADVSNW